MNKNEKNMLIGIFLVIIGIFMPWHGAREYFMDGSSLVVPTISGYVLVTGWVMFALSIVMTVFNLIPKSELSYERIIVAQKFILALIVALLIISGISPVFTTRLVTPHIGLPFMIIGCVVTYANLRKLEISQH
ncbi:MAG TPA: hypothetical protein DCG34_01680 [Clostridiales bacterium]|jgi:hypothetical protein|nr:hypothetical protein [Clostridiales bacterium]